MVNIKIKGNILTENAMKILLKKHLKQCTRAI